ncbi:MAG: Asp-tRNA(Asn)/Glu-tRNA(Gln) amidotransferase subunit GatC [Candidatus Velthaea sp.]|jgi:aspartyl-tRNA(Asn)/glutamyl-tRNA(Gln) amidotransferase subunit C
MASDRIDVPHVAKLARLALTPAEIDLYGAQLANLLTFVDELRRLDTDSVAATAQVIEARNVGRPDAVLPGLSHEDALAGAPAVQIGYFRVPQIITAE